MSASILRKARESAELSSRFFEANAERVSECADALAKRLSRGGKLFAVGNGGSACDAQHIAVEFAHPIVEKRRPLPALALARSNFGYVLMARNDVERARLVFKRNADDPSLRRTSPKDV